MPVIFGFPSARASFPQELDGARDTQDVGYGRHSVEVGETQEEERAARTVRSLTLCLQISDCNKTGVHYR